MISNLEFLREKQLVGDSSKGVTGILPFSRATLWRLTKEGRFPKPVKLGLGITAWRRSDVDAWIASVEQSVSQGTKL